MLLLELQRYKETVGWVALGEEVTGQCQEQLTQIFIEILIEVHLVSLMQKLRGQGHLGPPHHGPDEEAILNKSKYDDNQAWRNWNATDKSFNKR